MARPISILEVTAEERRELERRIGAATTPARDGIRARIVPVSYTHLRAHETDS